MCATVYENFLKLLLLKKTTNMKCLHLLAITFQINMAKKIITNTKCLHLPAVISSLNLRYKSLVPHLMAMAGVAIFLAE